MLRCTALCYTPLYCTILCSATLCYAILDYKQYADARAMKLVCEMNMIRLTLYA